ncbi:TRAP transporter small permease [Blautia schinkii]|nr:TRAP transporter small permease [Blautia schinkii]
MEKNFLRPVMDKIEKIIFPIQSICVYCSVLMVFITVMARELFHFSIVWGYEVACFFVIVLLFIGMPVNLHHNTNLKVTALYDVFPSSVQKALNVLHFLIILFVLILMAVGFKEYMSKLGHVVMAASKFPNWLYYGAIGIGIVLSLVEMLTEVLDLLVKKDKSMQS